MPQKPGLPSVRAIALLLAVAVAAPAAALDSIQWSGFALIRPQTTASGTPLDDDSISAQIQAGIDWRPSSWFGTHLHLLARNEDDDSERGRFGVVEAFLEQNFIAGGGRFHLMEGAFFLPTSRENIDSLWESPYTITSSALNTWMGEEIRPIGIDAAYIRRFSTAGVLTAAGTVFRGNDTFGALPVDRGWAMRDHWILLGERIPATATLDTSVSAETDGRLGWSGRLKWNNDRGAIQYTRVDNRADALRYGDLFNWATRFNIAGADWTAGDWTALGEWGWGSTAIQGRTRRSFPISAGYLMVSRRLANWRVSVRGDRYDVRDNPDHAITAAVLYEGIPRLRVGVEGIAATGEKRAALEVRGRF